MGLPEQQKEGRIKETITAKLIPPNNITITRRGTLGNKKLYSNSINIPVKAFFELIPNIKKQLEHQEFMQEFKQKE